MAAREEGRLRLRTGLLTHQRGPGHFPGLQWPWAGSSKSSRGLWVNQRVFSRLEAPEVEAGRRKGRRPAAEEGLFGGVLLLRSRIGTERPVVSGSTAGYDQPHCLG